MKNFMHASLGCAVLALAALLPARIQADDWPQFRGPDGAGISSAKNLAIEWSPNKNVAWKVKVPGYGWSSPIVSDNKVMVTTAVANRQKAPLRKGPGQPTWPHRRRCRRRTATRPAGPTGWTG